MALWIVFLTLRLGSVLTANGTVFPDFLLPKFYLNQLLPPIFASFFEADIFMMGALLPHAILACFGIVACVRVVPPPTGRGLPYFLSALSLLNSIFQ